MHVINTCYSIEWGRLWSWSGVQWRLEVMEWQCFLLLSVSQQTCCIVVMHIDGVLQPSLCMCVYSCHKFCCIGTPWCLYGRCVWSWPIYSVRTRGWRSLRLFWYTISLYVLITSCVPSYAHIKSYPHPVCLQVINTVCIFGHPLLLLRAGEYSLCSPSAKEFTYKCVHLVGGVPVRSTNGAFPLWTIINQVIRQHCCLLCMYLTEMCSITSLRWRLFAIVWVCVLTSDS